MKKFIVICALTALTVSAARAQFVWFDGQHPISYQVVGKVDPVVKIALQMFLYDLFVEKGAGGTAISNAVYAPARLFVSPVQSIPASPLFTSIMKERLSEMLREISDTSVPFSRTVDAKTCSHCDFKTICGR